MKKLKKPTGFDEKSDPMQDINIEFSDDDDDEIIDLEDIIEMPSRSINEEEDLDLDVEILDADSDFDFDAEIARSGGESSSDELSMKDFSPKLTKEEDEALLKALGDESEDEDDLFGLLDAGGTGQKSSDEDDPFGILAAVEADKKAAEKKPVANAKKSVTDEDPFGIMQAVGAKKKPAEKKPAPEKSDEDDDPFGILASVEADNKPAVKEPVDEDDPFGILAAVEAEKKPAAKKPDDEDPFGILAAMETGKEGDAPDESRLLSDEDEDLLSDFDDLIAGSKAEPAEEDVEPQVPEVLPPEMIEAGMIEAAAQESIEATKMSAPPVEDFQMEAFVDELVGRIEAGLMENVRAIVEARLPDVAREIIREEIEKLKKELG